MNKKHIFFVITFIFLQVSVFAASDISVLANFYMGRSDYKDINDHLHREGLTPSFDLDFSNYNLLFARDHIGFFEHINFHYDYGNNTFKDSFVEQLFGIAVGVQASPRFVVQGGPAYHLLFTFTDHDSNKAFYYQMGIAHDLHLKLNVANCFNLISGFYVAFDMSRTEEINIKGSWYYRITEDFTNFCFAPYVGLNFTF